MTGFTHKEIISSTHRGDLHFPPLRATLEVHDDGFSPAEGNGGAAGYEIRRSEASDYGNQTSQRERNKRAASAARTW